MNQCSHTVFIRAFASSSHTQSEKVKLYVNIIYNNICLDTRVSHTRDDQKVLTPLYFGLPGNENLTITFQYNLPLNNALSPSLLKLSYPFKIHVEGIFLAPKYSFTASMTPSLLPYCMGMGFQFWEQIEVRRSHIRRIWGMRKYFKSTFSRSSHNNL